MRFLIFVLGFAAVFAQAPPALAPAGQNPAPMPGQQPVPKPAQEQPPANQTPAAMPGSTSGAGTLSITLEDALTRARAYGQQYLAANIAAQVAREDRVQAKAALLPTLNYFNQFIYTEPNGTPSGVFVANDGPHIYNSQAIVHGDIFAPGKRAEYQRAIAAETVARAKADIAARGMIATIVQNFYGMVVAQRKAVNAQLSLREAQQFLDIAQKQERGGEVAHSDVIKAQIQVEQRQRDAQESQLAVVKSRVGLAIFIFPDFRQDFSVVDDLQTAKLLPAFAEIQGLAANNSPDIRAAQAALRQETLGVSVARAAFLPTLTFDYFYGIDANQFAIYNREHNRNLGSAAQAQMTIPVWDWGANRSKMRQARLRVQQAKVDLSFTQRQLLANLNSFYQEAQAASSQLESLRRSLDLSAESLRLTLLRYQAGEVTVLEVADAQTTLVAARNAYDDGLIRYRVALAGLQTLTGTF